MVLELGFLAEPRLVFAIFLFLFDNAQDSLYMNFKGFLISSI